MNTTPITRVALAVPLCLSACVADGGSTASADAGPSLVGSWSLETWTVGDAPRCSEDEGRYSGQIMYSADGHMSAQLGCSDLPTDDLAELSAEEAMARLQRRHFSYYGTYTVDLEAGTVTHHVEGSSSAAWVGTNRVRSFTFEGPDRVRLSTVESDNHLVWRRN
jgi:hypothetical protein